MRAQATSGEQRAAHASSRSHDVLLAGDEEYRSEQGAPW
jgi:hypothetical protein